MSDLVVLLKLFRWQLCLFNKMVMYYSSYNYYYSCVLYRFLSQKYNYFSPGIKRISLQVSNADIVSTEDLEILDALENIEVISGQKSVLQYVGSRYVGTTKRGFYLSELHICRDKIFFVLEALSIFFLPNLQKRLGQFTSTLVNPECFVICCKDLQVFQNYFSPVLKSNFLISIYAFEESAFAFLDMLQSFKFNIKQ